MAKRKETNLSYAEFMNIPEVLPLEKDSHGLRYVFTRDSAMLHDFMETRRSVFAGREETKKSLSENEGWNYGLDSHVVTILDGNKCVGGAVVVINHCDGTPGVLPLEKAGTSLKETLPELHLERTPHAQFKSLFIKHEYADWISSANLFRCICNICFFFNVPYVFAIAPAATARRNRIGARRIGVNIQILDDITLPTEPRWNGFQRQLLFSDIREKLQ